MDLQIFHLYDLFLLSGTLQHFFHTHQQLQNLKRFDDIILCSRSQSLDLGIYICLSRDINDRYAMFFHNSEKFKAVFARQHNIQQCQVKILLFLQCSLNFIAIQNRNHFVAGHFQIHTDQL